MAAIVPGQGSGSGSGGVLENPFESNNVSFFVQDTAPTALATGDRWTKTSDNGLAGSAGDYFWTGSLWVTENLFFQQAGASRTLAQINSDLTEGGSFGLLTTNAPLSGIPFGFNSTIYLDHVNFFTYAQFFTTPNFSASHSFQLWPAIANHPTVDAFAVTVNNTGIIESPGSTKFASFALTTAIVLGSSPIGIRMNCFVRSIVGSPAFAGSGNINIGMAIGIRGVHP